MTLPLEFRDDIFFCPGCSQFHDVKTEKPVDVPGIDYYEYRGKTYKIRKPKKKAKINQVFKGFRKHYETDTKLTG